ncbi:hypothetical protein HGP17_29830 [Rhizobium sp. P38BS-XIX]|uniref:hypothetical protein n=1 Tax=Rhizobium sp. P38BS-XIX TaxID=2726740 RepID=UPI001456E026|nr:hypothetical protein [Rhizobium sp. P38BS-XIX]NLS01052.1 hypothetical protein [Rhizobium sp. P38BS-XIX]
MKPVLISLLAAAVTLSGCQSPQQSLDSAYASCDRIGLRPGSMEYRRCTQNIYAENRQKSDQAAAAVAVGVAATAVGAYAISEASKKKDRRDRDRYYPDRRRYYDDYPRRPGYPYGTRPNW